MKPAHKLWARRRRRDPNRQRIVDAARIHFFNHGFRSVTMDDLAEELGMTPKEGYTGILKIVLEGTLTSKGRKA